MTLRQHMRERHPRAILRRGHRDLVREHGNQHHRYSPDHYHAGPNRGPDERPVGWVTGADVMMKQAGGFMNGRLTRPVKLTIGTNEDHERVELELELRAEERPRQTVEHNPIESYTEVSISGVTYPRGWRPGWHARSAGQIVAELDRIAKPAIAESDIRRIKELWERWHLNGMKAACAHQTVVYEDSYFGRRPSLTLTEPCPESGYRYGTAWLVEPVPDSVIAELIQLFTEEGAQE